MTRYKAITLTPPWGTLIAIGAKRIETRSWPTSWRGPLLIHQGSNLKPIGGESGLIDILSSDPFHRVLYAAGYGDKPLPMGRIVAVCRIVHIGETTGDGYKLTNLSAPLTVVLPAQERAFGDYTPGRYAWLLADIRALDEPIAARGLPGLWDWEGELHL